VSEETHARLREPAGQERGLEAHIEGLLFSL